MQQQTKIIVYKNMYDNLCISKINQLKLIIKN